MENLNFWSKLFILNSYSIVEASAEIRENGYEKKQGPYTNTHEILS